MKVTKKLVFELPIAMRWGEMDALGHMNNAIYFRYMEQARVQWLETIVQLPLISGDQCLVIVNAQCNYRVPIVYPETVLVQLFVGAPGNSSFPTLYELRDQNTGATLYADGAATAVWIDHVAGRSAPLPDRLRKQLLS